MKFYSGIKWKLHRLKDQYCQKLPIIHTNDMFTCCSLSKIDGKTHAIGEALIKRPQCGHWLQPSKTVSTENEFSNTFGCGNFNASLHLTPYGQVWWVDDQVQNTVRFPVIAKFSSHSSEPQPIKYWLLQSATKQKGTKMKPELFTYLGWNAVHRLGLHTCFPVKPWQMTLVFLSM